MGKSFNGVKELQVREQFTNSCPSNMSIFLKKWKPRNLKELSQMAKQYLDSHNKKVSSKIMVARQDVTDNKLPGSGNQKNVLRCFACNTRGHKAVDCPSRTSTSQNELNSCFCRSNCSKCGSTEHDTTDYRNSSPRI